MKSFVFKFGFISGAISAALMFLTFVLLRGPWLFENGQFVGYGGMVLSFAIIFVGVRSYREQTGEGSVSFGKAFQVGLLMALISCCCYTVAWLFINHFLYPNFADDYTQHEMNRLRQSGAAEAVLQQKMKMMEEYKSLTANPFMNALITFTEPLPVGFIVALISAAILRKKPAKP
ncbi:MAG: DUF4199 domain-containing protein [Bacteroidota bacterium]